ncbi:unnamed protein product [Prorocentrum cordatum]|uniref:Uncharacterized protein n=1 Tax=Prorocentrum cordatum TaxID=2364126 RepID=A0ABN9YDD3_9DINO|nr:unnamed protein product [Polarella glacialis]
MNWRAFRATWQQVASSVELNSNAMPVGDSSSERLALAAVNIMLVLRAFPCPSSLLCFPRVHSELLLVGANAAAYCAHASRLKLGCGGGRSPLQEKSMSRMSHDMHDMALLAKWPKYAEKQFWWRCGDQSTHDTV